VGDIVHKSALTKLLTIVIPNWNGLHHLQSCLPALTRQTFKAFGIIVVDNGSTDDSCKYISEFYPQVEILRFSENTGFAVACNAGIDATDSPWVVLLNNDTEPEPDWLQKLIDASNIYGEEVAAYASCMIQMDHPELLDDSGDILTWRGGTFKRGHGQHVDYFTRNEEVMMPCAGAAMYRRHTLKALGGFDPLFFAYLEDVDLGLRLCLSGKHCIYVADARVLHAGHGSKMATDKYIFLTARNRILLFLKNIPIILLLRHAGALTYGWLFYYFAHHCAWMYLRGTFAVLKYLPHIIRSRSKLRGQRQLTLPQINNLLKHQWPEITLTALMRMRIREIYNRYRGLS